MGKLSIKGGKLSGEVIVPSSKSICHRAIICSGLSQGESALSNITISKDIEASSSAIINLGAVIKNQDSLLKVIGIDGKTNNISKATIDCDESGSTLRFFIPIAAAMGIDTLFKGSGKLVERPLRAYYDIFDKQGFEYTNDDGKLPLRIKGRLKPGEFRVAGNVSSQFISGLILALPILEDNSKIILTSELESKPYVDLTLDVLKAYGVHIENKAYKEFIIKGNQKYKNCNYFVEGDYSQAAFWLTANFLGSDIKCSGLNKASKQGDKAIVHLLERLENITSEIIIDAAEIPDLVPILAVAATLSNKEVRIINAARLRFKESDRLLAISTELNKIGGNVTVTEDGLYIKGKDKLVGGEVDSWNDHRIAMALSIAAIKCDKPVIINNYQCINKSYPQFYEDYKKLGGVIIEGNLGE